MRVFLAIVLMGAVFFRPALGAELKEDLPSFLKGPTPIEKMVGETFTYDIAFLWFDRLAEGRLSFTRGDRPGTYQAVLEARTLGIAAWLTNDRVQRYVSVMEVGPDGRLRSLTHDSHIIKGKGKDHEDRVKRYIFDYRKNQVLERVIRNGKARKEKSIPMAEQPPNDILTAFYNFRAGFFGRVVPGAKYRLPAFSRKGNSEIVVEVLDRRDQPKESFFPRGGMLVKVTVDPEIFDTGGGSIYVWFNNFSQPAMGMVENVIGMGDVKGRMRYQ